MRPLTATEIAVVRWFALQIDEPQRESLINDVDKATADEIRDEQLTIRFDLEDYTRPPYRFERPLPIDAAVLDTDGSTLAVVLATDENGRLFQLQVIRFEDGPILGPDWSTLRLLSPSEVIRLNDPPVRKTK